MWLYETYLTEQKSHYIHKVTTYKNSLSLGHNHLLTTGTDNPTLWLLPEYQRVKGHQYRWLADGYDREIEHF